jgi:hypothetical protein
MALVLLISHIALNIIDSVRRPTYCPASPGPLMNLTDASQALSHPLCLCVLNILCPYSRLPTPPTYSISARLSGYTVL